MSPSEHAILKVARSHRTSGDERMSKSANLLSKKQLWSWTKLSKTMTSWFWTSSNHKQQTEKHLFMKNCYTLHENSGSLWYSCLVLLLFPHSSVSAVLLSGWGSMTTRSFTAREGWHDLERKPKNPIQVIPHIKKKKSKL